MSLRPISPCQPTQAMARPVFSYLGNPHPTFPGGDHDFYGCLYPGLGRPDGGFLDFGLWARSDRKLHINTLELKVVILVLHHWVSVLQGHQLMVHYRQHYPVQIIFLKIQAKSSRTESAKSSLTEQDPLPLTIFF